MAVVEVARCLFCGAVVGCLIGDHLLDGVVVDAAQWNPVAIDKEPRGLADVEIVGKLDTGVNGSLGLGGIRAGFDLVRGLTGLGDRAVEGQSGSFVACEAGLAVKNGGGVVKERLVPTEFGHAHSVGRSAVSLRMDLCQGKILIDDVRFGEVRSDLVHGGLGVFAMRALEVGKFDNLQILAGVALGWAVGALDECGAVLSEGMIAEGQDFSAGDEVFAVRKDEELKGARLLVALFADYDDYRGDAGNVGFGDSLDLVDAIWIKAPGSLQKGIDLLFGRRIGREIRGIRFGEGRAGSSIRSLRWGSRNIGLSHQ